ncbi:MAG: hypothetical protein V4819_20850 [Verrucomicrobiota bacterium]
MTSNFGITPRSRLTARHRPELAALFYNLEALVAGMNLAKSAKITQREVLLARRWKRDGLLSAAGLAAVEAAAR